MDRETRQYWRSQRREMLQRDRRARGGNYSQNLLMTKILIGLLVLSYIVVVHMPSLVEPILIAPGGIVLSLFLSAIFPGGLLGLIFAGVFLWIIGSQLEGLTTWWQYLLLFFVSGIVGALLDRALGGALLGGTYASFGLAGAYVMAMANRRVGGMAQWAILLLAINVVLSGFNAGLLAGMLGAFFVGLLMARLVRL